MIRTLSRQVQPMNYRGFGTGISPTRATRDAEKRTSTSLTQRKPDGSLHLHRPASLSHSRDDSVDVSRTEQPTSNNWLCLKFGAVERCDALKSHLITLSKAARGCLKAEAHSWVPHSDFAGHAGRSLTYAGWWRTSASWPLSSPTPECSRQFATSIASFAR